MVHFPTGYYSHLIGNGGGLGLNYKYNINRYFGIMVDLAYTYASFSQSYDLVNLNTYSHILDIKLALVLQYETLKNKNGLVPWLSVGFGSSLNIFWC